MRGSRLVAVCPYGVFEIRRLLPEDKATLSCGKLQAWAHAVSSLCGRPAVLSCVLVRACPENAIRLLLRGTLIH